MNQKNFLAVATAIFALIAILHALRLAYGWSAVIGNVTMPMWVSWASLIIGAFLAYQGFGLLKRG